MTYIWAALPLTATALNLLAQQAHAALHAHALWFRHTHTHLHTQCVHFSYMCDHYTQTCRHTNSKCMWVHSFGLVQLAGIDCILL